MRPPRPPRSPRLSLAALPLLLAAAASAQDPAEPLRQVLGEPSSDLVQTDNTLLDVAHRQRLGFDAVTRLNPHLDVWIPEPGEVVRLPTQFIPPDGPERGLVINVPEMRLYDYTQGPEPELFALGIGDEVDPTLQGEFRIGAKRRDPTWFVPESIRAERPDLPPAVPPGPENPLGTRWMTIGSTSYGIHGTNNPWSIGRQATHGCLRLYNDEMERLYERVPTRTPVRLGYQTVKIGQLRGGIYVEAHPDVYRRVADAAGDAIQRLAELGLLERVDPAALERAIREARGTPVRVGALPDAPDQPTSKPAS